jgi:cytochrome b561
MRPSETSYTLVAKIIHWVMAVAIGSAWSLGFYMQAIPLSPEKLMLYSWHKWLGVTLFFLAWVRLLWRITHRPPPLPHTISPPAQYAAQAVHLGLYFLMFLVPISGWLMSSAKGFTTVWFGILPLPNLIQPNKSAAHLLLTAHQGLTWILLIAVIGHTLAALWHHFIRNDNLLKRMG